MISANGKPGWLCQTECRWLERGQDTELSVAYTPSRGAVLVTRAGTPVPLLRCTQPRCSVELEPGTKVQLTALVGEDATFGGYHQYPMRTPPALVPILGDPL